MESGFEKMLWGSRLIVIVAILASLVSGVGIFAMATVDTSSLVGHVFGYFRIGDDQEAHEMQRSLLVTECVEVIDGYLLATMMLIFAFGLYELFISQIDPAERIASASKILVIKTLDDLKDRLSKLVLLILIVKYFQNSLAKATNTTELLYFAIGIFLIGISLYISHKKHPHS